MIMNFVTSMRLQNIKCKCKARQSTKLSTADMERESDEQDVSDGVKGAVYVV